MLFRRKRPFSSLQPSSLFSISGSGAGDIIQFGYAAQVTRASSFFSHKEPTWNMLLQVPRMEKRICQMHRRDESRCNWKAATRVRAYCMITACSAACPHERISRVSGRSRKGRRGRPPSIQLADIQHAPPVGESASFPLGNLRKSIIIARRHPVAVGWQRVIALIMGSHYDGWMLRRGGGRWAHQDRCASRNRYGKISLEGSRYNTGPSINEVRSCFGILCPHFSR